MKLFLGHDLGGTGRKERMGRERGDETRGMKELRPSQAIAYMCYIHRGKGEERRGEERGKTLREAWAPFCLGGQQKDGYVPCRHL